MKLMLLMKFQHHSREPLLAHKPVENALISVAMSRLAIATAPMSISENNCTPNTVFLSTPSLLCSRSALSRPHL
jgi:hypothetical protein